LKVYAARVDRDANDIRFLAAQCQARTAAEVLAITESVMGNRPLCRNRNTFFSVEIARRLTSGRLVLFDVQPEMLEKTRRKLNGADCHNAEFHTGEASEELPFPDSCFDVAFLAAVLGDVGDKSACIRSLGGVSRLGVCWCSWNGLPIWIV
jgi:Methyltransferase domain